MSHRRPEASTPGLDKVLRNALRLAADSVDPAADGLDRIRAKIAARQRSRQMRWRMAATGYAMAYLEPVWRLLGPAGQWLRRAARAVAIRFRPDPQRADWLGWLRPAAAVATGLFVVAAASWAIAALPSVITTSTGNTQQVHNSGGPGGAAGSTSSAAGQPSSSSGPGGETSFYGSPAPSGSASCTSTTPKPSASATKPAGSPSPSPSPSVSSTSASPSASPSLSPSPSSTTTSSPSPTITPSAAASSSPGPATKKTQAVQASRLERGVQSRAYKAGASASPVPSQTSGAPLRPASPPCA